VLQVLEDGLGLFPGVAGAPVIAGGVVCVAEAGEGAGFAVAVPGLAEQVECLVVALDGLPVVAEVVMGVGETVECFGLPRLVAEVAGARVIGSRKGCRSRSAAYAVCR